jgi:hypothetical protein
VRGRLRDPLAPGDSEEGPQQTGHEQGEPDRQRRQKPAEPKRERLEQVAKHYIRVASGYATDRSCRQPTSSAVGAREQRNDGRKDAVARGRHAST